MDASIMDGKTLDAGAVASVKNIRNPVLLAEAVMKCSNHVLLSGEGAMDFAKEQKITTEPDDYFYSQFRYKQWQQLQWAQLAQWLAINMEMLQQLQAQAE